MPINHPKHTQVDQSLPIDKKVTGLMAQAKKNFLKAAISTFEPGLMQVGALVFCVCFFVFVFVGGKGCILIIGSCLLMRKEQIDSQGKRAEEKHGGSALCSLSLCSCVSVFTLCTCVLHAEHVRAAVAGRRCYIHLTRITSLCSHIVHCFAARRAHQSCCMEEGVPGLCRLDRMHMHGVGAIHVIICIVFVT